MQLALPLAFDRQFSFKNYYASQGQFITESLMSFVNHNDESLVGIWGGRDSGKSHLANACAGYARQQSERFQLYDGHQLIACDPQQFSGFTSGELLLIDNLDAMCGHRQWEQKFYQIINSCKHGELSLLFTLSAKPQLLNCVLPDFQSRLCWGLLLRLPDLTDTEIGEIVQYRASLLGIQLSSEVIAYLLAHYSRSLSGQMAILRKLDKQSLAAKKRVTIPFIKQTLARN